MFLRTFANSLDRLGALEADRLIVACSGGLDSSVLLHALVALQPAPPILAVHVNHGLHDCAARFEEQVTALCQTLSVPLSIRHVDVDPDSGRGPEAAARDARYAVFDGLLQTGDVLLSAHHRDDHAETLLLQLMRASGPRGLSGVPERRPLGRGCIVRPLLGVARADLFDYAQQHALLWAEDPSNADSGFDRNFVRHAVLPLLESRFASASSRLARSASLQGEAQSILDEVAAADLASAGGDPARLPIDVLEDLSRPRQKNLLRTCLRVLSLGEPGYLRSEAMLDDLIAAKADAQPLVQWDGGEARRHRGNVYLMAPLAKLASAGMTFDEDAVASLEGNGRLSLLASTSAGLAPEYLQQRLHVRYRAGGERLQPLGDSHQRSLKSLLQSAAIVPWMRDRVPLIYCGEQLLAVADLWLAADCCAPNGLQPVWQGKPPLR